MDRITPTMSGDEESGTAQKQEQPIITEQRQQQQQQPFDDVVVDVNELTIPEKKMETKASTRIMMSRKTKIFFISLVLVGVLVAAITVPIVKNNQKQRNSSSTSSSATSAVSLSAAEEEGGGGNEQAEEEEEPFVLDPSVPEGTPTLVVVGGGESTKNGSAPVAGTAKATDTTGSSGSFEPLWPGVSDSIGFYDESVVQGYADMADFQADLMAVAKMMVNLVVARSTGKYNYYGGATGAPMPEGRPVAAPSPAMPTVGNGVNDFGSNNQEDNVEEGDKIVSDGTRVFASYGDYIIAWDVATGKQLAMARMEKFGEQYGNGQTEQSTSNNGNIPVDNTEGQADGKRAFFSDSMPIYYEPRPTIMSLLLVNNRLIVAVDGGYQTGPVERILSSYGQTRVLVYDTESLTLDPNNGDDTVLGNMTRLSSRDYNGQFVAFRAIGENLHTVTTSQINTYSTLVAPAERYNYEQYGGGYQTLTDQEYMGRVKADAEAKLLPNFVNKLTKELMLEDGTLPNLARISKFLTHTSDVNPEMDQYYLYDNGIVNSVTLVHSMNIEQPAISSSSAGVFLPSYSAQVYSSKDFMIVAGPGYDYSPWRMASTESTYLMAMKLNGATSTPYSVGTVEGSFLNQRSFDVVDNVLRVATTIQNFWRWVQPMPMILDPIPMMETETTETTTNNGEAADDPLVLATDETGSSGGGGGGVTTGSDATLVFVDIPEPVIVDDEPIATPVPPPIDTQSSTENYIITMKLPSEDDDNHGMMQELDRIKLGKPHETFTSVRFYDNVAYAVTFERKDPFYVLNVTDPSNLQVLAEVNITGFSSYLHSMNDENNMILAIGQEADEFGTVLGLQISLFDVRNVNNIKVLRHNIETDPNVYSDTAGMWDVMAIRFNRETGRLIIPVDMTNWQQPSADFHGFRVYSVTETSIQEDENCRVDMGNANQMSNMCFYCASLEPRAMIMNGNMMLTKSHFVKSIDMNDCTTQWEFAVNSTYDPTTGCCGYY